MKFLEPSEKQLEAVDTMKPNPIIPTGITDGTVASTLEVYRLPTVTVVVPCGEAQNAEPWSHKGRPSAKQIKAAYLKLFEK